MQTVLKCSNSKSSQPGMNVDGICGTKFSTSLRKSFFFFFVATICVESYRIVARALSGVYMRYAQLISVYDRYG